MTEFKNTAHELRLFRMRLLAASVMVLVCFSLLLARFLWLQVVRHDAYAAQAEENRISVVPIVPNRGLIMDRNGVVLARNYSAYTLEITPSKIRTNIDDLIDELGTLVEIQPRDRRRFRRLQEESKNFESVPIRTRLTDEEVAKFTAQRYRFPGVEVQARLFRQYPYGKTAAHVIGYIGRISQRDAERIADSDDEANYNGTDYIGKEGLEKSYENQLHGTTGYEEVEISASGRAVRSLSRTPATPGKNLILSIDIELQKVVEEAFGDQKGALVAINPATGDILAYVSQPSYDPNLFVEGIDQQSWDELNKSPDRPLLNRPLSGVYSPGSTYKPFMALAALELGRRRPQDAIRDPGYFILGNHRFRDDKEGGHGVVDMYRSVVISCDTYYYMLANDMGVNAIHDFMKPFGFGQITGIDLEHEKRGILPSTEWKRNAFRKPEQKRWIAGDTVSLGIGQGYNSFTPLQMAQATAILANNGVVMKPHLVKIVEDGVTHERTETVPKESYRIPLKQENIDFIKRAMVGVVKEGTGAAAFRGAPYDSGGKTGTAQVVNIAKNQKYDSRKLSRIYHDNGLYIGFAPADAPRIAIAAVVENGGWGAGVAAPLVRKAMDYFMLGKRPNEPIKSVAPEVVSPDTPVEGPTSEDSGASNTPTVQPDVQE
ncbi:penicillin-binding protein 2 [Herbaspirillum sp. AP02]|uniref:penicillin-binding protein 2 n=1 Tax=unclassified Herbaspirillum TaxID=2624150 RepID=UPI0015D97115|nr:MULTISPECIES: penicillin-binding protein 2 [unclassified Herbaspirillum]MBG7621749.1 penicillin-binding protein 2 [Herbaspirillum sp. AP02]NZD67129.1 penicillin-binding protein 2 [Herbaspirillum sp. AP21]